MAVKPIPDGAAYTASAPKRGIPKKPMPPRSNAGGVTRGRARAALVQATKPASQRRLPGTPAAPIAPLPVKAPAQRRMPIVPVSAPKQGLPPKTIGTGPNPIAPPTPVSAPARNITGPAWLRRPAPGSPKQAM